MQDIFQIGAITTSHGVHGEMKVFPTTDNPAKFKRLKEVIVDHGKEKKTMAVQGVKFSKNMVILKLEGMETPEEVLKYKGSTLWITREQSGPLRRNEYFQADLIGLSVFDETGNELGKITDVIETGANDVYELTMDNGQVVLLPAIRECILDVNVEEGTMHIHMMDGLM